MSVDFMVQGLAILKASLTSTSALTQGLQQFTKIKSLRWRFDKLFPSCRCYKICSYQLWCYFEAYITLVALCGAAKSSLCCVNEHYHEFTAHLWLHFPWYNLRCTFSDGISNIIKSLYIYHFSLWQQGIFVWVTKVSLSFKL